MRVRCVHVHACTHDVRVYACLYVYAHMCGWVMIGTCAYVSMCIHVKFYIHVCIAMYEFV